MTEFLFEWDPVKAEANLRKHDIAFEDAVAVFRDPFRVTLQDRIEGGEYRWQTIGIANGSRFLLVAHADTDSQDGSVIHVRVISARKATKTEVKFYDTENRPLYL